MPTYISQKPEFVGYPQGESENRIQPWRNIKGMPDKGKDIEFEKGVKGITQTSGSIRLDCLADVGTNLGG
jgi:hypothetical protein